MISIKLFLYDVPDSGRRGDGNIDVDDGRQATLPLLLTQQCRALAVGASPTLQPSPDLP